MNKTRVHFDMNYGRALRRKSKEDEKTIKITLSKNMKTFLESDFLNVTLLNKLVDLPCSPNVIEILEDYYRTWAVDQVIKFTKRRNRKTKFWKKTCEKDDLQSVIQNMRICREVMSGIQTSFDFCLQEILLYRQEQEQYKRMNFFSIIEDNPIYNSFQKRHEASNDNAGWDIVSCSTFSPENVEEYEETCNPSLKDPMKCFSEDLRFTDLTNAATAKSRDQDFHESSHAGNRTVGIKLEAESDESLPHSQLMDLNQIDVESDYLAEFTDTLSQASGDDTEMYYPREHVFSSRAGQPWYQEALNQLLSGRFKKLECSTTQAQILSRVLDEPFAPKSQILLPSTVYGAPHLARLFVKLPDILDYSEASVQKLRIISKHLRMFLRYLESNVDWFDNACYQGGELQSESHFTD